MEKIKILREKTGAGIVECKKALEEAGGDVEKAAEILRKKGIAKAAKRSDKEASEGMIMVSLNEGATTGYILEINAETDFVARNEKFQALASMIMELAKKNNPKNLSEILSLNSEKGTVKDNLDYLSGVIGEKLAVKRYGFLRSNGTVAAYTHQGGRIGALAALDQRGKRELAYEIAMQIAAANPKYIKPEDVPGDVLNKEKEIYREQLLKEGKKEEMIERIMPGKLNKYFAEACLVKQEYIKDDVKRVQDILGGVKVEKFIRYSL